MTCIRLALVVTLVWATLVSQAWAVNYGQWAQWLAFAVGLGTILYVIGFGADD